MEIYLEKQLINIVYSIILGLIFGILYDIIRIIHVICNIASYSGKNRFIKREKVPFLVFFVFDVIYMTVVTAVYSLFTYWANNGIFRLFLFIPTCVGFTLYYFTVGKVVISFSEAVTKFLRFVFKKVIVLPALFVMRLAWRIAGFIYKYTVGILIETARKMYMHIRSSHISRSFSKDIRFNFQIGGIK